MGYSLVATAIQPPNPVNSDEAAERLTTVEKVTPLVRQPNYVAALGDSITIGDGLVAGSYLGGNVPFTWACLLSNGVLVPVAGGNLGVGGETSTQIAARVGSVVALNPAPSRCFVMAGTNDCNGSLNLTTYAANIATIVAVLRDANIEPILQLIPPKSVNGTEVARVNAWLSGYGVTRRPDLGNPARAATARIPTPMSRKRWDN